MTEDLHINMPKKLGLMAYILKENSRVSCDFSRTNIATHANQYQVQGGGVNI